jgi:LPS-assembly protein
MRRAILLTTVVFLLGFALSSALAQKSATTVAKVLDPEAPVYIQAETLGYDKASATYTFDGEVVLTQGHLRIEAEHATFDDAKQVATARGDVWVTNEDAVLRCDETSLQVETRTGIVLRGQVVTQDEQNRYYVSGDRIEKVGDDRYLIRKGAYTTCDCGVRTPSWRLQGRSLDVTLDGYATIRDAVLYWWKVPVFYTPWAMVPVKITRQTGFLTPDWAWSSRSGAQVRLPFYWAIGPRTDATLYNEYLSERGFKEGIEYRYRPFKEMLGEARLNFIQDRKYGNGPGDFRWALTAEGRWRFVDTFEERHEVSLVSDPQYVLDFDRDVPARFDRYLRTTAILGNRWEHYSLNAAALYYQDLTRDDDAYTFQRLPQVTFAQISRPLVWPLLLRFDAAAVNFHRQKVETFQEDTNLLLGEELFVTRGTRLALSPELILPWNFKNYAIVTPRAGLVESVYYLPDRGDWRDVRRALGTDLGDAKENGHWDFRHAYFAELDVSTEFQRVFPLGGRLVQGLKHSIEPGVLYRYEAEPLGQDDLPIFDGFDRLARENVVTAYLYNRLWVKAFSLKEQKTITLRLIDLRIEQAFDIEETLRKRRFDLLALDPPVVEEAKRRPFRDLHLELRALLATGFFVSKALLRSDLDWDLYDFYLSRGDAMLALISTRDDALYVEYRYRTDDRGDKAIQSLVANLDVHIMPYLSVLGGTKYNFLDREFIENVGGLRYASQQHCWSLELRVEDKSRPKELVVRLLLDLAGLAEIQGSQGF